ncbi:MAG: MarR family transcriptional regulator [Victivallaceae bacterium]|jgi:DNA-binding MarR family transcriptional regulator
MEKKYCHNELVSFADRDHEALMGVWWTGILLKKRAKHFFSNFLSSEVQFNIMMVLKYAEKPLTQSELGEQLLVDKSNITGLLDRMEKSGLIRRLSVPDDRRCYHIELTGTGREILEKVEQPYRDYVKKLMAEFSAKEIDDINRYMARLEKAVAAEESTAFKYRS